MIFHKFGLEFRIENSSGVECVKMTIVYYKNSVISKEDNCLRLN